MKKCELCGGIARMHCESDQANLCWDCDVKVHEANFLVAKHTRTLLCHVCQNPTPWLASGQHLSPAVSVCESCVANKNTTCEMTTEQEESSEGEYEDEEEDYDDDDDEGEGGEEEDDAENQVVPWSEVSSSFSMSKPAASSDSLSSSEGGLKRMRESPSFCYEDEIGFSSSHVGSSNGEASSSMSSTRLSKLPRLAEDNHSARNQDHGDSESGSTAIISSLKRLQKTHDHQ
ncbi:zinc finger protein CONSTANS-LIKE 4 [Gossypium australe]|uniref:Zinc finger protein CONSTANS-LIKE 4 n=1 Tax=Gossypium australe TaxID=47621 RepID=A0A5B6VEL4_9ROSI|nr:zinc finger protein CONSTANS-LIKE 4 [Gossypium australe]